MALFDSWSDVGYGVAAGSGIAAINSALGVGNSFLSDWFGDNNREESAAQELWNYGKKSFMDWDMYSQYYAPLNQQLEKEMFDYTSAGNLANSKDYFDYTLGKNYEASIKSIGDSLAARKQALIDNGYNPILAVNPGASASSVGGSTIGSSGQLGAIGSPHSASSSSGGYNSVTSNLGRLSLSELLGIATTSKQLDRMDAEQKEIQARTLKTIEETKKPGMAGDTVRTLDRVVKDIGERITDTWHSAVDYFKNKINPVQELHYHHYDGNWQYDRDNRKMMYNPK